MGELIFEWIIGGIYVAIRALYDWIKEKLFGIKDKQKAELKKIEKKILYKKIKLTENLDNGLKIGLNGAVLEVIG
ncbi:hypothetical protein [Cellulophaga sp. Hel_I_12]|uniref:hypothetical protein n=1 Tax=Cellulophaga sp. Hel_I_12 TaxID=1249972 RepID=UPI000646D2F6|nr:hypothetical protein [Cellulophaga sp. Hel_I_12]